MLRLENISFAVNDGTEKSNGKEILKNINLEIEDNSFVLSLIHI